MAEIATIARPYAEALFKAAGGDGAALKQQLACPLRVAAALRSGIEQFDHDLGFGEYPLQQHRVTHRKHFFGRYAPT